ncbi:hypothetical protein A2774_01650 [Candidatus Roizmanbacteria bacterium RIFCSPHIGHO2_01_FULL_39_12c]|uniref:PD(D/E)XK endonuclease domain-containing protein n=1 Tax=Candidatus Roizmanbacteria bacterium RIFCSPHIGHO2_01_FULL_39_12c TaxID=1802031 RepID=A0A1F7GAU0_9BACT|nr:MAG: hypothetical protein A2774_01650 [Candidatus Roizmanbacteria bacterium RIFCSPHIGHO2_01_FULL_39_12c]
MNTKELGDVAVAQAINYFVSQGYEVCLPIGDKRHYDIVIEKNGKLKKVQVKFAGLYKNKNQCKVGLRITGGNQSYSYAKKYSDNAFESLFVYTERGERYFLPWDKVDCRNELTIETDKYKKYRV